jgi:hypothetical protein
MCTSCPRPPEGTKVFTGEQYFRAWGVIKLFFEGHAPELIRLGTVFQTDIDELNRLMHQWLMNPEVWTRKTEEGFSVPPTDTFLITAPEPGRSLRLPVMVKLRAMQDGIILEFCAYVDMLTEKCFSGLSGPVYNPGADSGDLEKGQDVPTCFAGKSGTRDLIPKKDWTPQVAAKLKQSGEMLKGAAKPSGVQIPCVSNPKGDVSYGLSRYARGCASYKDYQYALAVCNAASFAEMMEAVYADEPATVLLADIKAEARYVSKCGEYAAEGKSSPKGQFVKDMLRCLVQVAGHPQLQRAHAVLNAKCTVRSTKNRISKGTHDLLCIIELSDGMLAEVQIGFTSVLAMKALAHAGYKYKRVPTDDLEVGSGLISLFLTTWFDFPSMYKGTQYHSDDCKYTAGYEVVTKEELAFISLR